MSRYSPSYAFLDCGAGRRLERLGGVTVSRPAPAAECSPSFCEVDWASDLSFTREHGWRGEPPPNWRAAFGPVVMGLRPASQGQIGVFPEHAAVAERMQMIVDRLPLPEDGRQALNLFGHTGLATLWLAARSKAVVAHVDASNTAVKQARENAELSGLAHAPVRWLVDDALGFMRRDARRGKLYQVIVADPPSYGRSKKAEWKFDRDLPELLELARALLEPRAGLLCLTCHSEGFDKRKAETMVRQALPDLPTVEAEQLFLASSGGGNALRSGVAVFAY